MSLYEPGMQHAALWLIGPDMPGLLRLGSEWVAARGGNIDKDIADKFGEKAVVFMSVTAKPADIARMDADKDGLKKESGCGVVFQPMKEPTVPDGFQPSLYGFDVITDDRPGLIAEITGLLDSFGMITVSHTGERRLVPGPRRQIQSGQKYVVMIPPDLDHQAFGRSLSILVKKYAGSIKAPLKTVPGLLWWW